MLNRHLWELRGGLSMIAKQITIERAVAARAKGWAALQERDYLARLEREGGRT